MKSSNVSIHAVRLGPIFCCFTVLNGGGGFRNTTASYFALFLLPLRVYAVQMTTAVLLGRYLLQALALCLYYGRLARLEVVSRHINF